MKNKTTIFLFLGFVCVFVAARIVDYLSTWMNEEFIEPLSFASIVIALVLFILIFLSKKYFNTWKKFAWWYIPTAAVLVTLSPVSASFSLFERQYMVMLSSIIFVAFSLGIFGWKWWRLRKEEEHLEANN
jgi:hypothetical protein